MDEEATGDWKPLLLVWFTMESVDSTDDVLLALVAKWLGAEPEVDVE
jgi:hypothetical protein